MAQVLHLSSTQPATSAAALLTWPVHLQDLALETRPTPIRVAQRSLTYCMAAFNFLWLRRTQAKIISSSAT